MDGFTHIQEKLPPHNLEAEQALLGSILCNNEAAYKVRDFLTDEMFYEPVHGRIYAACLTLMDASKTADPVRLKPYFEGDESLQDVGGASYLVRLAASAATILNAREYGESIRDLALRRAIIGVADLMSAEAYSAPVDADASEQIEAAESQLHSLHSDTSSKRVIRSTATVVDSAIKRFEAARDAEGIVGRTTGFKTLDQVFTLNDSELTILAGRPSMGKSALGNIICFAASRGHAKQEPAGAVFFSKEMDAEDNLARAISQTIWARHQVAVPYFRIKRGALNLREFELVREAANELRDVKITWVDEAKLTPSRIRMICKREARKFEREGSRLGLVVVDYLQQVKPDRRSTQGLYADITEVSGAHLELAKEMQVPVLALSQLSRAVEQRENKRPLLSDLRESGALEQDAANIIFAYREEYYLEKEKPTQPSNDWEQRMAQAAGKTDLIIAKNRNGPTDTVTLISNMALNHFQDMTQ